MKFAWPINGEGNKNVEAKMCIMVKKWFLYGVLILQSYLNHANEIKFENYYVQDGISDPCVNAIYQDSHGFIWIGTKNGLNKFDGYNFSVYRSHQSDKKYLREEYINCISEGSGQNLLIGTWGGGLVIFVPEKEEFVHLMNDAEEINSISHNWVRVIFNDSQNRTWIGTQNGLNLFEPSTRTFTRYLTDIHNPENPTELKLTSIYGIDEDTQGNLWIATWSGLIVFNPETGQIIQLQKDTHPDIISTNRLQCIHVDSNNDIWLGTYKAGLTRLKNIRITGNTIQASRTDYVMKWNSPDGISDMRVNDISGDVLGNLWVATESGLNYFNFQTGNFKQYFYNTRNPNSLSSNYLNDVYTDKNGILWIGTFDNGLCKYDKNWQKFTESFPEINLSDNSLITYVKSVYQDNRNRYWIGTDYGLFLYDQDRELIKILKHDPEDITSIDIGGITGVCQDLNNNYWIVTWGGGLHKLNTSTWEFMRLPRQGNDPFENRKYDDPFDSNNLGDADVRCVKTDIYGQIWMGTSSGFLDCYNIEEHKFYHHFIFDFDSIRGVPITSLETTRSGMIWGGSFENGGLVKIDPKTRKIKRFFVDSTKNSLLSDDIYSLAVDHADNLWIGTDIGLCKLDLVRNTFIDFSQITETSNMVVNNIEIDRTGDLWLSTATKLICFNLVTKTKTEYDAHDGIRSISSTGITDNRGNVIIGGMNGINMFNPGDFSRNTKIPEIVLTDFKLFNKSIDYKDEDAVIKKHINFIEEIRLDHDQAFFSIEFASLNYSQTSKNQYRYKLSGIDKNWVQVNNSRIANYTNIKPGSYTFKVMGSNNDGVWNTSGKSLKIIINPPWYKTWYAYSIYFVILMATLFVIIRISVFREKMRNEIVLQQLSAKKDKEMLNKEREIDQMKLHFFTNISHEFRTPLTLILGPADEIMKKAGTGNPIVQHISVIKKNATRLLRLVNQIMDFTKVESKFMKFSVKQDDIAVHISNIIETFQYKAEKRDIRYISTATHTSVLGYFDADKIEKILYNLISNAFKFTPDKGLIEISTRFYNKRQLCSPDERYADLMEFRISDSGIGISEEDQKIIFNRFYQGVNSSNGTGIGLSLAYSLARIHGGNIEVESQKGCGSVFKLKIPLTLEQMENYEVVQDEMNIEERFSELEMEKIDEVEFVECNEPDNDIVEKYKDKNLVLVIEDNTDMQNYIKGLLENDFYVELAENGQSGMQKAVKLVPDLIISDIMMPVMDGLKLCEALKQKTQTSHIPVILLTAKANSEDRLKGLMLGADDYIVKPFEGEELRLKIHNIIMTRSRFQEQFVIENNLKAPHDSFNSVDDKFIKKLFELLEENLSDPDFDHKILSKEVGMSRAQLYRKLKALTDKSVHEFIRLYRLEKSLELLRDHGLTVSEVMYSVGFKNHSYFTKCFKEKYGISPTDYQNSMV